MSIIEIEHLAKSYRVYQKREGLRASLAGLFHRQYRQVEAVRGIDVRIEQGEFVAFLGPNGAGKTTTLKLLSGVITPTAGTAHVMGYVPWKRENAYRRRFALVMGQKNQLWWDLPAAESFRLHQHIYRIEARQFEATLAELTELLGVGGLLGQPVRELSLGERMKMELIAALLHYPTCSFSTSRPRPGRGCPAQRADIPEALPAGPQGDPALDQSLHEGRGGAVPPGDHHCRGADHLRRFALRDHRPFQRAQVISLQLNGEGRLEDLGRYGGILSIEPPKARLRVARAAVPEVLAAILAGHVVEDVSVEDPPLEEVIAEAFSHAAETQRRQ